MVVSIFPHPTHWELTTIGEVATRGGGNIQTGPFGSQLHASDYVPIGIPSVMPQNIGDNEIREDSIAYITEEDAIRLTRYRLKTGDIVYSRRGDVERRALVQPYQTGWLCGTGCLRIRFGNGPVLPEFAAFYLAHPEVRSYIVQHAIGATMPNLNTSILSGVPFLLPPKEEQHVIASLLGSLDKKIDLNRRMNETLEAMARAIFKDWFVDFGPVRAKAEGRPPYLAPNLWALFPDALDDDDKPVGWNYEPLDKVASFLNGLALQKYPPESDEFLPVIKIAELRSGITDKSSKASLNIPSQYIVEDGDVLFSWSGSLTHLVWTNGKGALNQHLFKVNSGLYPKWFFYYWIEQHMPIFQAVAESKATTMGHIQRHHITEALTTIPNKPVLEAANELIAPLFERTIANNLENRTLAQLRDLLLPRLMSGEIRLCDAEKVVEAVA